MPPFKTPLERLFTTQRRLNRGTLGGTLENAGPTQIGAAPLQVQPVGLSGGGKPYATIVVASSQTAAAGAASADYVCDGTADEVEINAALSALSTSYAGGQIVLLDGVFELSAAVDISLAAAPVTLRGMGQSTALQRSSGSIITMSSMTADLIDFAVTSSGGGSPLGTIDVTTCTNCTFQNVYGSGVMIDCNGGGYLDFRGCRLFSPGASGVACIQFRGTVNSALVTGCTLADNSAGDGLLIGGSTTNVVVTGNLIRRNIQPLSGGGFAGVHVTGTANNVVVVGNVLTNNDNPTLVDVGASATIASNAT